MMLDQPLRDACRAIGIEVPRRIEPGRWTASPVEGKARSNTSGRVMVNPDGRSGVAWNHATGEHQRFWIGKEDGEAAPTRERDLEAERRAEAERQEVEAICARMIAAAKPEKHDYLRRKGFPDEIGLVLDHPRDLLPESPLGERIAWAMPQSDGPLLIVPGRIGKRVTTLQFIAADGTKKNILGGTMGGACHRIATGRETWVCEGIATALSVRAALRLLGRPATVLCAFSAANVGKVASGIPGAIIAADHDRPVETLGGLGTGEYYARRSGCQWVQPPALGDFNDTHQAEGLRAVAVHLRGVVMG